MPAVTISASSRAEFVKSAAQCLVKEYHFDFNLKRREIVGSQLAMRRLLDLALKNITIKYATAAELRRSEFGRYNKNSDVS